MICSPILANETKEKIQDALWPKLLLFSFRSCNLLSLQISCKRGNNIDNLLFAKNSLEKNFLRTNILKVKGMKDTNKQEVQLFTVNESSNTIDTNRREKLNYINTLLSVIAVVEKKNNKPIFAIKKQDKGEDNQYNIAEQNIFADLRSLEDMVLPPNNIPNETQVGEEFFRSFGIKATDFNPQPSWRDYNFQISFGKEIEGFLGKDMRISINSMLFWQQGNIFKSALPVFIPVGLKNALIFKISPTKNFWINMGASKNIYFVPQFYGIYDNFLTAKLHEQYGKANENLSLGLLFGFGINIYKKMIMDFYITYNTFFSLWEIVHFFSKFIFGYPMAGYTQYYDNNFTLRPETLGLQVNLSLI
jgi:hypothetical protein